MPNRIAFCERSDFLEDLLTQHQLVALNFTAAWSGPCNCIKHELELLASPYRQQLTTIDIDIDRNPNTVRQLNIVHLPTVSIVWRQERVQDLVGLISCKDIEAAIAKTCDLETFMAAA